jgi:hypothetical protein
MQLLETKTTILLYILYEYIAKCITNVNVNNYLHSEQYLK